MSKPVIPDSYKEEFIGAMDFSDDDDLADGAWYAMLEDTARRFMRKRKIHGDSNEAVQYYLYLTKHQ